MARPTIDEMISVMQAWKDGKTIQVKSRCGNDRWDDSACPRWNWDTWEYRVKPKPREWWAVVDSRGDIVRSDESRAEAVLMSQNRNGSSVVKVREVIEG